MNPFDFFVDLPRFANPICATIEDKDLFFPEGPKLEAEILHQLKAISRSSTHEKECKEYALEKQIPYGVFGGLSATERNALIDEENKDNILKGMALKVYKLHQKGFTANEIADKLLTSRSYARRVLKELLATEQGAVLLHQQTKNSSKGLG